MVLLEAGRGTSQPVSSVLAPFLYLCGGQKWGQGSSTVEGAWGAGGPGPTPLQVPFVCSQPSHSSRKKISREL